MNNNSTWILLLGGGGETDLWNVQPIRYVGEILNWVL
jgi:hypothetical protein